MSLIGNWRERKKRIARTGGKPLWWLVVVLILVVFFIYYLGRIEQLPK